MSVHGQILKTDLKTLFMALEGHIIQRHPEEQTQAEAPVGTSDGALRSLTGTIEPRKAGENKPLDQGGR